MNKTEFIKALQQKTNYTEQQCVIVNDVLESHFVFKKKNRPVIVEEIKMKLEIEQSEAEQLTEAALAILKEEIKHAKRHPFGSRK